MGPFGIAAIGSMAISGYQTLTAPDPNEENRRIAALNRDLINERMRILQALFANRDKYFGEAMDVLNPQLAFADTQGRQAAVAGAKASQASVRRSLGPGGEVFGPGISASAGTVATDRQNTLRSLAVSEAWKAVQARIASESSIIGGLPIGFNPPHMPGNNAQNASLFANIATAFAHQNQLQGQNNGTPPAPTAGIRSGVGQGAHVGPWYENNG